MSMTRWVRALGIRPATPPASSPLAAAFDPGGAAERADAVVEGRSFPSPLSPSPPSWCSVWRS